MQGFLRLSVFAQRIDVLDESLTEQVVVHHPLCVWIVHQVNLFGWRITRNHTVEVVTQWAPDWAVDATDLGAEEDVIRDRVTEQEVGVIRLL